MIDLIELTFYKAGGEVTIPVKRDKAKGDKYDSSAWARCVAELGLDGWELVTASSAGYGVHNLWFKRLQP